MMKLGSLFDGSGGFPLAGALAGIEPVWAAEIEPYPIAVTRSRFPRMRHLGSVSDVFQSTHPARGATDPYTGCERKRWEWVIIGAETGNRKGKIIPKREWVENIVEAAQITGMKVFMKESLRGLMGADFRQEFPWEV